MFDRIKVALWNFFVWLPFGSLCSFTVGREKISVTKDAAYVVVSDGKTTDALPLGMVSPELVKQVFEEIAKKWFAPDFIKDAARKVGEEMDAQVKARSGAIA